MELRVIQPKTWRWYTVAAVLILVSMLLSAWIAWHLSHQVRNSLEQVVMQLTSKNEQLQDTILGYEKHITELGRSEQMAKASVNQTGLNMAQLQQTNKQLEKELSFYRSIMAPELDKNGLNIQAFEILKVENDIYEFSLTLTQVKKQDWYIKGSYSIELVSDIDGKEVKTALNPLVIDSPYKPRFSFRYFQTLSSRFQLPQTMKPQAILVSARTQDGKQRVTKRYPWTQ
jgi:cell division protein FtsB